MRPELMSTAAVRVAALVLIIAGGLTLAAPTQAQQPVSSPADGRASGMRYLTWPGKIDPSLAVASSASTAAQDRREPASRGPILSMPSEPMVLPPISSRYSARSSPGPTPASAWVSNGGAPAFSAPAPYAASPSFAPPPPMERADAAPPSNPGAPVYMPEPHRDFAPAPPLEAPAPAYAPPSPSRPAAADTGPAALPLMAAAPPATSADPAPAYDPMAPRPDAPIFRLVGRHAAPMPMPAPLAAEDAPGREETADRAERADALPESMAVETPPPAPYVERDRSPRRYSVHRANTQTQDRQPLADPVLLDSAPVDLAQPPPTPTVMRNVDGRLQAIVPNEDPSLP